MTNKFKEQFKIEIDNFVSEIAQRKNDINEGTLFNINCIVGKNLISFGQTTFTKNFCPLVYSTPGGVKLDYIFHRADKKTYHNASNFFDIQKLIYAIKYEILANKDLYENITLDDFYYIYWGYFTRLIKRFNWGQTYNKDGNVEYLTWMEDEKTNILSNSAVKFMYTTIFINNDNFVYDIYGKKRQINMKNREYNIMKRLSKEDIINIIETFKEKPTVRQIMDYYDNSLTEEEREDPQKSITIQLLRAYIKSYELEDKISITKYKKLR